MNKLLRFSLVTVLTLLVGVAVANVVASRAEQDAQVKSNEKIALADANVFKYSIDSYVGSFYEGLSVPVNNNEILAAVGATSINDVTVSAILPDGTRTTDYRNGGIAADGWRKADGTFVNWGDNAVYYVQPNLPDGIYIVGAMPGAVTAATTFTTQFAYVNNSTQEEAIVEIELCYLTEPRIVLDVVKTLVIDHYETPNTPYCEDEPAPKFSTAQVCAALGIKDISLAQTYIQNVTTGAFVRNTTDGWRNADGDAANWGDCTNGFCLKLNNPASGEFDYTGAHDANFNEGDLYIAKWAVAYEGKAVILEVNIHFGSEPQDEPIEVVPSVDNLCSPEWSLYDHTNITEMSEIVGPDLEAMKDGGLMLSFPDKYKYFNEPYYMTVQASMTHSGYTLPIKIDEPTPAYEPITFPGDEIIDDEDYVVTIPAGGITIYLPSASGKVDSIVAQNNSEFVYEFHTSDYAVPQAAQLVNGKDYYLYNIEAGKFLGAGNSWGTQGSFLAHGQRFTAKDLGNGKWALDSHVSNGGESHYLGANGFVDGAAAQLNIYQYGSVCAMTVDGTNYFGYDSQNPNVLSTTAATSYKDAAAQWKFYTKEDLQKLFRFAEEDMAVDATFLLKDPNFSRNNSDKSAWQVSSDCTNKNLAGGANENMCAESYHSTFTITQTAEVPNGTYRVKAQGFYRNDGSNPSIPCFIANTKTSNFPLKTGSENSMADASASFTAGLYTCEPMVVKVTDGTLTIGVRNLDNTSLWCIWDNFEIECIEVEAESANLLKVPSIGAIATNNMVYASGIALTEESYANIMAEGLGLSFPDTKLAEGAVIAVEGTVYCDGVPASFHSAFEAPKGSHIIYPFEYEHTYKIEIPIGGARLALHSCAVDAPHRPTSHCESTTLAASKQVYTFEFTTPKAPVEGELASGTYYLYNIAANAFISSGANWGTHAIFTDENTGYDLAVNKVEDGIYTIDSKVANGEKHFLGADAYVDQNAFNWHVQFTGEENETMGKVYTISNGTTYLGCDGSKIVSKDVTDIENAKWVFLTKEQIIANMDKANENLGVDVTCFITGPNFNYLDGERNKAWSVAPAIGGFRDANNSTYVNSHCGERWNAGAEEISQTITGIPNGVYELSCYAFYRQGNIADQTTNSQNNAYLFANDEQTLIKSVVDEATEESNDWNTTAYTVDGSQVFAPNSMADASKAFSSGLFYNLVKVTVLNNTLKIGVKKAAAVEFDWLIFDEFSLTYYGNPGAVGGNATEIAGVSTIGNSVPVEFYSASGARLAAPVKGINIVKMADNTVKKIYVK